MSLPVNLRAVPVACVFLVLAILLSGCTSLPADLPRAENSGTISVWFLDVGQGDSSLVLFNGTVILIDAGETDQGSRVVEYLSSLGVDHIDLLVASHPHSDHIGGMGAVLAAFPVKQVLDAGGPPTSGVYEQFRKEIGRQHIPYTIAERGQTPAVDPDLRVLVLSPPAGQRAEDLNGNSIVMEISYRNVSFLFPGDAGSAAEDAVLAAGYLPRGEVLKVSHHGSADAASVLFLSAIHPEIAVFSIAADNPYGYPHRETLGLLHGAGATVYRTDRDGSVLVRSNGTGYTVLAGNDGGLTDAIAQEPEIPQFTPVPLPEIPVPAAVTVPVVTIPALPVSNGSTVRIEAVRFDAPGDDRMNLNGEWVRIGNNGTGTVLLAGWTLSDNSGYTYRFPAFLLMPGGNVTVCTGSGSMNDTALFMGRSEPLWGNGGDTAVLRDAAARIIDRHESGTS